MRDNVVCSSVICRYISLPYGRVFHQHPLAGTQSPDLGGATRPGSCHTGIVEITLEQRVDRDGRSLVLLRNRMARMQSAPLAYLLYCNDRMLGDRLERVLAGLPVRRVTSRKALLESSVGACAVVFGTTTCSDEAFEWLRSAFGPVSPPCVVVAPLSVNSLRRLYPLRSGRLQVVWTDEATSRLAEVLEDFRRVSRGPMWQLGLKLLSDYSFRPSIRKTISRVCGLHSDSAGVPFIPVHSVGHLARHVGLAASTLSRYWRREVPLRCSLKEFLSWAVLLWAVRARSRGRVERHRRSGGPPTPHPGEKLLADGRMYACGGGGRP